jgi:hypothetical protein
MIAPAAKPEPYLPPKELGDALVSQGIQGFDLRACRRLVNAVRADGVPVVRRKYVRASDAARWLIDHPDWSPFSAKAPRAGVLCVGP